MRRLVDTACFEATTLTLQDFVFPHVPLEYIRGHAAGIMAGSPIAYVKDAKLRGSLFSPNEVGLISGVDSNFLVDQGEPFKALAWLREEGIWPLGDLPDGHEFLLVFKVSRRRRSRSLSSGRRVE